MKKIIEKGALLLVLAFTVLSCTKWTANGDKVSQERNVDHFDGIISKGSMEVQVRKGEEQKVTLSGSSNIIDLITTKVENRTLTIDVKEEISNNDVIIYIEMPELELAELQGSGVLYVSGSFEGGLIELSCKGSGIVEAHDLDVAVLTAELEGSGVIDLEEVDAKEVEMELDGSGIIVVRESKTDKAEIELEGSGKIKALGLDSKVAEIDVDGSGDVEITVQEEIYVSIKGSGNVSYAGDAILPVPPELDGSGKLIKL